MTRRVTIVVACGLWVAAVAEAVCDSSTFPVDLNNTQVLGLSQVDAGSADACEQACCQRAGCDVWQYAATGPASPLHSCWIGAAGATQPGDGWVSRGRNIAPPPPPPPPPPSGPYMVDDSMGLGLRWEGIGAISGGGATSKLLMDYPPNVVSDILDYLFLPNFGLNLQILKVELGGDADATEGAEPSHMHFQGDLNFNRGYEWWLMKEAKRRNPDIKLYGLPWAWPGWLDPSATSDRPAQNAFANPSVTANYTLAWLLGAKQVHGLNIDYIGQWNERDAPGNYADALREVVAQHSPQTTVLNRLPHYPGTTTSPDPQGCRQYTWNTTDGSRWVDEEGSVADGQSARCLARCVSRNYVTGCHTATFQWHLISSFYDYLPWARCGVAVANTPWSGAYEVTSPTWALAHTTQFAPVGWRYTSHAGGVGLLSKGGSYVTRVSPDLRDLSIVVEKMTHDDSNCARGSNPGYSVETEVVTFIFNGSFAHLTALHVWYSNLTDGNDSKQLFLQLADLPIVNNRATLTVRADELYTLTTLTTGNKGSHPIPAPAPLPIPYLQNFDAENVYSPPALWYDQMGAWEVHASGDSSHGNVMRQMVPVWPACWGYSCNGPTTYFGPSTLNASLNISFSFLAEEEVDLSLELQGAGGPTLTLATNGTWSFGRSSGGGLHFEPNVWHQIQVLAYPDRCTAVLDGAVVGTASASGNGYRLQLSLNRYIFANLDDFALLPL